MVLFEAVLSVVKVFLNLRDRFPESAPIDFQLFEITGLDVFITQLCSHFF